MAASRLDVSAPRDSARSASLPVSSNARRRLIVRVLAVVSSRRAPSRMRSASRSPSARGMGSLVGVQAQRVQCGQVGIDRVRLAPPPLAPAGT